MSSPEEERLDEHGECKAEIHKLTERWESVCVVLGEHTDTDPEQVLGAISYLRARCREPVPLASLKGVVRASAGEGSIILTCDCDTRSDKCALGRERTLATTDYNRCGLIVPAVFMKSLRERGL